MPTYKKGFAPILIILTLIAIIVIAFVGLKYSINSHNSFTRENMIPLTQDQTLLPTTSPTPLDETTNWKTYTNKNLGFLVKYPDKIALREVKKGENMMVVFDNYNELGYQPGKDSMLGNEIENKSIYIDISVELVNENTTLEQYLDQKYPDRDGNAAKYGLPSFQNRKNEMKSLSIGGEKGLFKETGMAFETISRKAWVKKGNKVFTFSASGSGETGTYVSDIAIETFDLMLSTLQFLN